MRIDVFTIFPEMVHNHLEWSIVRRAQEQGAVDVVVHDLRAGAGDARGSVDDAPFGGGAGMVMMAEPIFNVVEASGCARPIYLLSPGGRIFDQAFARELASGSGGDAVAGKTGATGGFAGGVGSGKAGGGGGGFSLICGRYEGVDQRVAEHLVDGEISVGDFVLAGGEIAALAIIEAVVRLVPGVLGNPESSVDESFEAGLVEYPQYTRPRVFRGWEVPAVLVSGNHGEIEKWRRAMARKRTAETRPDLLEIGDG